MKNISVVLATRNEENNIADCIDSVKEIAHEIIIVDERSEDRTVEIAERMGAKVYSVDHEPIFHKTKQKALDKASCEWILQLDADERVTPALADEILEVIGMDDEEIRNRRPEDLSKWSLFQRHVQAYEHMHGNMGSQTGEVVAFLLPRKNHFVGQPLIHAGVYPDPAIRLIKKGKAHFPAKSVHENMKIDGEVAWLFHDLEHHDSPTLSKYIMRMNRYTDLQSDEFAESKLSKSWLTLLYFSTLKPKMTFLKLFLRHKGYKDGMRGFLWSLFSAMHFPLAYYKYYTKQYTE
jgi:glycosyltransferase involved in cell wall biosynthesis